MPATFASLPPELLLKILETAQLLSLPDLGPAFTSPHVPQPDPLCLTALVSRQFGAISQSILFRSVTFRRRREARQWRATGAAVHTRAMRLAYRYGCQSAGWSGPDPEVSLPLGELFAPLESGKEQPRIKALSLGQTVEDELDGGFYGAALVQGLESLALCTPLPSSTADTPPFPELDSVSFRLAVHVPFLSAATFPSVTRLALTIPADCLPNPSFPSFPSLTHLILAPTFLPGPSRDNARPNPLSFDHAPASLAHFESRIPAHVTPGLVGALPASVRTVVLEQARAAELDDILARWCSGRAEAEVGRLTGLVRRGLCLPQSELAEWDELCSRLAAAGCEVRYELATRY